MNRPPGLKGKQIGLFYAKKRAQMRERQQAKINLENAIWVTYVENVATAGHDKAVALVRQKFPDKASYCGRLINSKLQEMGGATYSVGEAVLVNHLQRLDATTKEWHSEIMRQIESLDEMASRGEKFVEIEQVDFANGKDSGTTVKKVSIDKRLAELHEQLADAAARLPEVIGRIVPKNNVNIINSGRSITELTDEQLEREIQAEKSRRIPTNIIVDDNG